MTFSGFGIKKPVITITGFFTFFNFFWPLLCAKVVKEETESIFIFIL